MTIIWVKANEYRVVRDTQQHVRVPHLALIRAEMPNPRLVRSDMRPDHPQEYGLRVDPLHSVKWWARHSDSSPGGSVKPKKFSVAGMADCRERYAAFRRKHGFGPDENTRQDRLRRYYALLKEAIDSANLRPESTEGKTPKGT